MSGALRTFAVALAVALVTTGGSAAAFVVTSKDIKNGTIKLVDISAKAKKALRGQRGLRGLQGSQGIQAITEVQGPGTVIPPGQAGDHDVDAVAIVLDHLRDASHLTFDSREPLAQLALRCRVAAHPGRRKPLTRS